MIDESPDPPPPMSTRRRILLGALAVAIVAGGYVGTQALFAAIVGPPAIDPGRPFDEQVKPFTSAEDGFTASFPSDPEVQSTVQQVDEFKIPITVYTSGTSTEQFAVTAAEMPAEVIALDLDTFLTGSFEGVASGAGAVLSGRSFTMLGGERAITGTIKVHDVTVHLTMALHEGEQITVSVVTDNPSTADAFVSSFSFD